ncbi:GT-D fold domain-containing glycosyltransferase [Helicobacter sp. 23-1044]
MDLAKNPHFYFDDSFGRRVFEDYLEILINPIKSLWRGKKVVVVEGFNSYFGVYNDLLDSASEVIRLNSYPPFDAFSKIDEILGDVMRVARKYEKDEICFIVALGASAKILCVELAMRGYIAYDMGNMSISYDCIIHKKDRKLIDTLNLQKEYILML